MRSKENGELGNGFFRATVRCRLGLRSGKFGLRQRKIVMSGNMWQICFPKALISWNKRTVTFVDFSSG